MARRDPRPLPPDAAALVGDFLQLDRRRLCPAPPLSPRERDRWLDLRWQLEEALGGPGPTPRHGPPRRSLRVPAQLEVRYVASGVESVGAAREIGETGILVEALQPLPVGTPLRLRLGCASGPVEVAGAVAWVRGPSQGTGPTGMGVRFEGLAARQREALAHLVQDALAAL